MGTPWNIYKSLTLVVVICHLLTPPCSLHILLHIPIRSHTHPYSICLRANTHIPTGYEPEFVPADMVFRWHSTFTPTGSPSPSAMPPTCTQRRPPWAGPEVKRPFHIQFFLWAASVILFTCFQPKLKQKPNVRVRERRNPGLRGAEWTDGLRVSLAFHPLCCGLQRYQPSQLLTLGV